MTGFVYAIGDDARVKIGWSADPEKRFAKIATDCPDKIELLGVVPATTDQEAELHSLLDRWRISGEWFRREGPVQIFVSILGKPVNPLVTHEHPLRQWRLNNSMTLIELANLAGVTPSHLSEVERGRNGTSLKLTAKLSEITGIPIAELAEAAE